MAEKVLKGITCPACAGELDLREGIKTFNCKYCGTLLLTKGVDGVIKYYVPRKVQRNIAIQNMFNWLGKGLAKAREIMHTGKYDIVILDELNIAIDLGLIPLSEAIELIVNKPALLHLVITGRSAKPEIIEVADLVTEMREIKHPFQKGILAQRAIDW